MDLKSIEFSNFEGVFGLVVVFEEELKENDFLDWGRWSSCLGGLFWFLQFGRWENEDLIMGGGIGASSCVVLVVLGSGAKENLDKDTKL